VVQELFVVLGETRLLRQFLVGILLSGLKEEVGVEQAVLWDIEKAGVERGEMLMLMCFWKAPRSYAVYSELRATMVHCSRC
jgi:hypothetical protein